MGWFKHEGATATPTRRRPVAFYMGDDTRFEDVYKFVTADRYAGQGSDGVHVVCLRPLLALAGLKGHPLALLQGLEPATGDG